MKTLTIVFDTRISEAEIKYFRGAIVSLTKSDLFHNHTLDGRLRYSYPRIQYKRIEGKAAIVFVGEGIDAMGEIFSHGGFDLSLGNRQCSMRIEQMFPAETETCFVSVPQKYRIKGWLALNGENYRKFSSTESLSGRITMLEGILQTNILSMLKSFDFYVHDRIRCTILDLVGPYTINYKDTRMRSFNATFASNFSLPLFIGLGKGVSLGHGTLLPFPKEENDTETM